MHALPPAAAAVNSAMAHHSMAPAPHHHHSHGHGLQQSHMSAHAHAMPPSSIILNGNSNTGGSNGKTKIHLRLIQDAESRSDSGRPPKRSSLFTSFGRRRRGGSFTSSLSPIESPMTDPSHESGNDRGKMTVSWYPGTSSLELQEHVRNSVVRKLELRGGIKLTDLRILDESSDPPEEIVLSPSIPNGSSFTLRFRIKESGGDATPVGPGPPDSPSAAPSPHPTIDELNGMGLTANQLALIGARLKMSQLPLNNGDTVKSNNRNSTRSANLDMPSLFIKPRKSSKNKTSSSSSSSSPALASSSRSAGSPRNGSKRGSGGGGGGGGNGDASSTGKPDKYDDAKSNEAVRGDSGDSSSSDDNDDDGDDDDKSKTSETVDMRSLHPEDPIEARLRQIAELLSAERSRPRVPKQEKRQVIFVLANYLVLFLSLIAISAEIQARAPEWHRSLERSFTRVQNCATDQEALFDCISNGDFAGLVASVVLWISRSAATRRIFLFGFATPHKLWTVVYESMVTAVCWGFSYMFIRRGMNPDTNRNFLQKYWKDAVYGSLAGFNAAFMKQVMKNLIPQEAIEDALQDRPLKILSWLPSFS